MFYSQDILQKRGGKFAKIWLAATKMSKLSRREVASVNVEKCCDEILAIVELRYKGGRRPKFSLYLSAQLMYGVVRIHSKNCEYLLNDVSNILIHVRTAPTLIDLQEIPKAEQVTNPELPLEEVQQEQEPYITALDMENLRTGHVDLGDFWGLNGSDACVAASPRKKRKKAQEEPVLQVANVSEITLQEPPPMLIDTPLSPIQPSKDVELPMLDGQEMDQLMGFQVEERPLQVSDLLPTSTPFSTDVIGAERQYLRSKQISGLESPIQVRQEDKEKTPERPPAEELPEPRAVPPSPGVTQIITSPLPRRQAPRKSLDLELTAVLPRPASRKRKRQLAFADAETQIPKTKMKQNMATGSDTCEELILPEVKGVTALDILTIPGINELRREPWLFLWRRNARFRRNIPDAELEIVEEISPQRSPAHEEQLPALGIQEPQLDIPVQEIPRMQEMEEMVRPEQPALSPVIPQHPEEQRKSKKLSTLEESVEELRNISMSMMGTPAPEISSIEIQRDASTSRIDERGMPGLEDSLQLDDSRQSKKDKTSTRRRRTRSSVASDAEQQAPPPAQDSLLSSTSLQTSHTSTGRTLYDLEEEYYVAVPLLQSVSEDMEQTLEEFLRCIVDEIEEGENNTTFRKICPPQLLDRKVAARKFTVLLNVCAKGLVIARQLRDDIYIRLAV